MSYLEYKNKGDNVQRLAKVEVNGIHCSFFIHKSNNFITKCNGLIRYDSLLVKLHWLSCRWTWQLPSHSCGLKCCPKNFFVVCWVCDIIWQRSCKVVVLILVGLFHTTRVESSHTAPIMWIIVFDWLLTEKMWANKFLFPLHKNSIIN